MEYKAGVRAENRAWMEAEILRLGRAQLKTRGPTALSLREVARDLGVASSAVYRYVKDRDALLTWLVVDAYTELGDAIQGAVDSTGVEKGDPASKLRAFAQGMRQWAVANPARWALIYGTPVPGYFANPGETSPSGIRVMEILARICSGFVSPAMQLPEGYARYLTDAASALDVVMPPELLSIALEAWCSICGSISMEVFGQLGPEGSLAGPGVLDQICQALAGRLTERE